MIRLCPVFFGPTMQSSGCPPLTVATASLVDVAEAPASHGTAVVARSVIDVSSTRLLRWQERTDRPLLVAALLFLVAYAVPILQPALPGWAADACRGVSVVVWVLFAVDLVVRIYLAKQRIKYTLSVWLDVLAVLLPALRPLRILRAVVAVRTLTHRGQALARGQVVGFVVAAVSGVCAVAALAVLDAERSSPDANITGIGDALWWSVSTVTTVGYGDHYPTTTEGRVVAIALMVTGIALLGVVTAALASWFVEHLSEVREAEEATNATVEDLAEQIRELRRELAERA